MNPLDALFDRLRRQQRKAFIPFLTVGDPEVAITERLGRELVRRGASLLELGFPYSDPIADGAVIQASYTRALNRGLRLEEVLACARRLADSPEVQQSGAPLVALVSYSLVYRRGPQVFLQQARAAGFSGVILPDLPLEEAEELAPAAAAHDLKLILLVTPTTPPARAQRIARLASGFLYCVTVTGITGERDQLPASLLAQLTWLRTQTSLPLCVGFGISRPEQVRRLRDVADGIIVGSALVRRLEEAQRRPTEELIQEIADFAVSLMNELHD